MQKKKATNPTINPENNPLLTQEQPTTNPQSTQEQPTDYPHTNKDNKENGTFIYLYRKFKNWEWFKDSTMVHLFIYLLIEANFSDKYYRGKFVKRGQIRASRRELARETGITEQKVRTALNRLKLSQEITIDITQHDHIISICKYDEYQCYIKPTTEVRTTYHTLGEAAWVQVHWYHA